MFTRKGASTEYPANPICLPANRDAYVISETMTKYSVGGALGCIHPSPGSSRLEVLPSTYGFAYIHRRDYGPAFHHLAASVNRRSHLHDSCQPSQLHWAGSLFLKEGGA